ncbi:ADP-ribose pyrophosphatase [Candidatus Saccharibacteria bacterium]|nr:MAG: ADP-ribose pyrophosphatase [Candidatus Saccharibacteria bacterium]
MTTQKPGVGLGVIILNDKGHILLGKRLGSHAPYWSIPGGKLELGETFEEGAIREINEEHGITILQPKVIALTNNLRTYRSEGVHFISVILLAKGYSGEPQILEPDKCQDLMWADPHALPMPHFDASGLAIRCFLNGTVYVGISGTTTDYQ